ncbi:hypothetical protein TNCV_3156501 [Trichonephila clavipes]|nr:hypothetical protein TNCV_3156501 [Trichonephila clavipes]
MNGGVWVHNNRRRHTCHLTSGGSHKTYRELKDGGSQQSRRRHMAEWLVNHASTPKVRGSTPGWARLTQPLISVVYKRVPSLLGNLTLGVSRQTGNLTETSAYAPQSPRSRILRWAQ